MQPSKPRPRRTRRARPALSSPPRKLAGTRSRHVLVERNAGGAFSKDMRSLLAGVYRRRIQLAQDAHARLGQNLTALKMEGYVCAKRLAAISRCPPDARASLARMNGWLEELSVYSRELVAQLTPNILIQLGFEAAASGAVRTSNQRSKGTAEFVRAGRTLRLDAMYSALAFDLFCDVLSELEKFSIGKVHLKFSRPDRALVITFEVNDLRRPYRPGANIRCLVAVLGGRMSCVGPRRGQVIELEIPILDLERLD
jgi:signal transduction histidine kinase